mgnify:CR=1 FL=1
MCYAIKFYSLNNNNCDCDDFSSYYHEENYKNSENNNLNIICRNKNVCNDIFYYYKKYIKYKSKYLCITTKIHNNIF